MKKEIIGKVGLGIFSLLTVLLVGLGITQSSKDTQVLGEQTIAPTVVPTSIPTPTFTSIPVKKVIYTFPTATPTLVVIQQPTKTPPTVVYQPPVQIVQVYDPTPTPQPTSQPLPTLDTQYESCKQEVETARNICQQQCDTQRETLQEQPAPPGFAGSYNAYNACSVDCMNKNQLSKCSY